MIFNFKARSPLVDIFNLSDLATEMATPMVEDTTGVEGDQLRSMSTEDVTRATPLLNNELRILKSISNSSKRLRLAYAKDCPFPVGWSHDNIYKNVRSAFTSQYGVSDNMSVCAYVDEKKESFSVLWNMRLWDGEFYAY